MLAVAHVCYDRSSSYRYWHSSPARVQLAELLLLHGANVRAAADDGSQPYTKAITPGDHKLARYLLERGADVHGTTAIGQNFWHAPCWESGLSWGREMKVPTINLLVINGADPNVHDEHGATPLCYLMHDHNTLTCVPDVYNALSRKGADPGAMNNQEHIPAGQFNPIKPFIDDAGLLQNTPPNPYTTMMRGQARWRGGPRFRST